MSISSDEIPDLKSDDESDDSSDKRDKRRQSANNNNNNNNNRSRQQILNPNVVNPRLTPGTVKPVSLKESMRKPVVQQQQDLQSSTSNIYFSIGDLIECKVDQAWVEGFILSCGKNYYQVRITQFCRCPSLCGCPKNSKLLSIPTTSSPGDVIRAIQIIPEVEAVDPMSLSRLSPRLLDKSDKESLKELQLTLKSEFKPAIFKNLCGKDIKDAAVRESWNNYLTYVLAVERVFLIEDLPIIDNGVVIGSISRYLQSFCNFISLDQDLLIKADTEESKIKLAQFAICGFPCKDITFKDTSNNLKQNNLMKDKRAYKQLISIYPKHPIIYTLKAIVDYQANNWMSMLNNLESAIKEDYVSRFLIDRVLDSTSKQGLSPLMDCLLRRYKIAYYKNTFRPSIDQNIINTIRTSSEKVVDDDDNDYDDTIPIKTTNIILNANENKQVVVDDIVLNCIVEESNIWHQLFDDIVQNPSTQIEFSWLKVRDEFDQILDSSQSIYGHTREWALADYDDDDDDDV